MRRSTLYPIVAVALVLSACSNDVSAPVSLKPVGSRTLMRLTGAPAGNPNSKKYHDTGLHPATGRSGSASLEARALLGMDGNTFIEASTGSLEAGTHSGTIAKAQVKAGSTTQNFNGLTNTGYWSTTTANLGRGQPVQVQANVRGIDPRRTDVVTVTTQVALRPDVAVNSVTAAQTAPPNLPVTIVANLSEANGDVGARADCQLAINGTTVDQADGIWIDAGGSVSCMFSHTFDAAGTYSLSVTAANVSPSDWDASNNSANASITISSPGGNIEQGYMGVSENHWSREYFYNERRFDLTSYDQFYHQGFEYTNAYASGYEPRFAEHPFQSASLELLVDGASVLSSTVTPSWSEAYDDGTYRYGCTYLYGNGRYADVCSSESRGSWASSNYNAQIVEGTTTYFGQDTYCDIFGCNTWVYNYPNTYGGGVALGLTAANVARFRVNFIDRDGGSHTIDESTALTSYTYGPQSDYTYCYDFDRGRACYGYVNHTGTSVNGSTSWYHP